jgi:hypothetical protein
MLRLRDVSAALLGLVMCCPVAARAEVAVGEATLIKTEVTGEDGPLVVKAPVHRDERIRTSIGGLGQFVFRDGTKLAVGAGSSVVIDSYVYDEANSVKKLTIKAAKGTFRWISGNSSSSAYSIVTPAGTIGVRGTAFDVYVAPNGTTAMVLLNGAAQFCGAGGCKQLRQQCDCVIASRHGGVSDPRRVDEATLQTLGNRKALPFLSGNQQLSGPLGNIRTSCGLRSIRVDRQDPARDVIPEAAPAPQRLAPPAPPQKPPQKPDKDHHHPDRHHHWDGPRGWHGHHWDGHQGGWGQRADDDERRTPRGWRDAGPGRERETQHERGRDHAGRERGGREQPGADRPARGMAARDQAGGGATDGGFRDYQGRRDRQQDGGSAMSGGQMHFGQMHSGQTRSGQTNAGQTNTSQTGGGSSNGASGNDGQSTAGQRSGWQGGGWHGGGWHGGGWNSGGGRGNGGHGMRDHGDQVP